MYKYKALKINGKRIDEHRHVMQLHLGRKLLKNEVVRHRDKNTLNNVIENLYLITRQEQVKEQLAAGEMSASILESQKRKAAGIKKFKKKWHPKDWVPKPIGRPTGSIQKKAVVKIEYGKESLPKKEKIYETKIVDTSKMISLRLDKKTTIYIKESTSQSEIDRIIKKHELKKIKSP